MRNKRHAATTDPAARPHARYEVLPTASTEDKVLEHVPRDRTITVTASPAQGARGHPRPGRAARRPRLRRRAAPGRAHDQRPRRARRDLRPARRQGHHPGVRARAATPSRPATTPTRSPCSRTSPRWARPFAHVGITGYPESHPTINDDLTIQSMWDKRRYATHVVSNLTFDPAVVRDWVGRMRGRGITMPLLLGIPGPGRPDQAARDGDQDRRGGVHPVPGQAQGHLRPAGRARRLHRRAVPGEVRAGAGRARRRWSRGCTSSPSTRSPRPRPGAPTCWSGLTVAVVRPAAPSEVRERPGSRPTSPVSTTVSGRPMLAAASSASARSSSSGSWASQTTRV